MASRGKHRKQSRAVAGVAKVALAGAIVGAPMALAATPANASTVNWDAIAQCESSGNWAANTGNGFYGGLQFTASTWQAYGGGQYASTANLASRDQQITIAEKVLAGQGIHAWPVCGSRGYTGTASVSIGSATVRATLEVTPKTHHTTHPTTHPTTHRGAPVPQAHQAPQSQPNGDYTVVSGDNLSGIAAHENVQGGWQTLWDKNKNVVANPNLIFPGQHLVTR